MRRYLITLLPALCLAAACGNGPSPLGPSATAKTEPGGATIRGSIVGLPQGTGAPVRLSSVTSATSGQSPVTVSVVGTTLSTTVTSGNQFTIAGVPPGRASLRFSGGDIETTDLELGDVEDDETIELTVSLTGTSASVESERRSARGESELEGRVESLPPTTAAGVFVVAGQTVATDTNTAFFLNGSSSSFSALQLGVRVHVKGTVSGTAFQATIVNIQNTNGTLPVNLNGEIAAFTGTAAAFQFTINGRLIKGTTTTTFYGNSSFADMANGQKAEVKGVQADGYVSAQRIHVEKSEKGKSGKVGDDSDDDDALVDDDADHDGPTAGKPDNNFKVDGTISGLSGTCPTLQFVVRGYTISTSQATKFDPTCSAMKTGTSVEVKGVLQSNGTVLATEVEK